MRILITGATGLLGSHLTAALARDHDVAGVDRHPWWGGQRARMHLGDLEDTTFLAGVIEDERPDILVHCAAMIDVDGCETDPAAAFRMNAEVTRELARRLPRAGGMVYVTTDGIFKGDKPFVVESTPPCPRTVYGRSKLTGEWDVELHVPNHLIVRTNFYGWSSGRKLSFAEWLYKALAEGTQITLFDDFYYTPMYVVDLVTRLEALIEARAVGRFHIVGRDRVSKHDFGVRVARHAGLSVEGITRGSIRNATFRAPRPPDMSLGSERLRELVGYEPPSVDAGIQRFLADRNRPLDERVRAHHRVALG